MKCAEAETFVHAYVDGELTGVDRGSFERHMTTCSACERAARLEARWKAAVRGHLPRVAAPAALRERLDAALGSAPPASGRLPWEVYPRVAPALAAAILLCAIVLTARQRSSASSPLMEQAVKTYNASMPLDVIDSNCASVARWFRGKLDFNVQPPALDKKATCQGGRLVNVRDHFGAYLVYTGPGGHRLALMVVDNDDEPYVGQRRRVLGGRDVYFGSARGASLAAYRDRDGLSYVMTSDLDEEALGRVVEAAFH